MSVLPLPSKSAATALENELTSLLLIFFQTSVALREMDQPPPEIPATSVPRTSSNSPKSRSERGRDEPPTTVQARVLPYQRVHAPPCVVKMSVLPSPSKSPKRSSFMATGVVVSGTRATVPLLR